MERILIYRTELLTYSETFIAAQAGAMRSYSPLFAGLRRVPNSLPLPAKSCVLTESSSLLDRLRRYSFLQSGRAPRWIRALAAEQPSLMHAHFAVDSAEALPLARALNIPLLVTLHGYDVMASDESHRRTMRGRIYLARRQQLLQEARLFLCVSDAIRQKALARGFPAARLRVHSIGIDTELYTPPTRPSAHPVILFVGRLVEKKGCIHLIRAMHEVQRVLPAARLVVVGDGPERLALETEARRIAPSTSFLGVQTAEQVRECMAAARVLAVPSITACDGDAEGLPTVLGEALAMGLPVACFRSAGIPEMVRSGVEGLLAEEGDEATLARNLLRLCQDDALAASMAAAGRWRIEQSYALRKQTAALEAIYTEILTVKVLRMKRPSGPEKGNPPQRVNLTKKPAVTAAGLLAMPGVPVSSPATAARSFALPTERLIRANKPTPSKDLHRAPHPLLQKGEER